MKLKCTCGSTDLKPLKFGGRDFKLQTQKKTNIWKGLGFYPDVWVCKECYPD